MGRLSLCKSRLAAMSIQALWDIQTEQPIPTSELEDYQEMVDIRVDEEFEAQKKRMNDRAGSVTDKINFGDSEDEEDHRQTFVYHHYDEIKKQVLFERRVTEFSPSDPLFPHSQQSEGPEKYWGSKLNVLKERNSDETDGEVDRALEDCDSHKTKKEAYRALKQYNSDDTNGEVEDRKEEVISPTQPMAALPGAGGERVPLSKKTPPYTEADDITKGVKCWFEGCPFKRFQWRPIYTHAQHQHGVTIDDIRDTYFHRQMNDECAAKARQRNQKKDKKSAATAAAADNKSEPTPRRDPVPPSSDNESQPFNWVEGYFACDSNGTPIFPLQWQPKSGKAMIQRSESRQLVTADPRLASALISASPSSSAEPPIPLSPSSSGMALLRDIHTKMGNMEQNHDLNANLPTVVIKDIFIKSSPPVPKGQDGRGRSVYPRSLEDTSLESKLEDYVGFVKREGGGSKEKLLRGAIRVLSAISVSPHPSKPDISIGDVDILVAIFKKGLHKEIIDLPIFAAQYAWSQFVAKGFQFYIEHHTRSITRLYFGKQKLKIDGYQAILSAMSKDLEGIISTKFKEHLHMSHLRKQKDDLAKIKKINVGVLKASLMYNLQSRRA